MKKITLFILVLLSVSSRAQTQFTSLQEALDFTRSNNPSLRAEQLSREVSHERLRTAWSLLMPQVRAFGTYDNNISLPVQLVPAQFLGGAEDEFLKVQFGTRYASTYGAEANLPLINVSNWKSLQSASVGEEISEYQLKDKELSLTEQVITAYYLALLSREAMVLNHELLNAADSLLAAAKVRLDNGMIEPLEFNRVKTLYLETDHNLRESEGSYRRNIDRLKSLSGIALKDSLVLTETIGVNPAASASALTITELMLPRYRMLSLRKDQAHTDLLKSKAKVLPELSLYARYTKQTFSNESNVFRSGQEWFDVGVVGLRADWIIFSGFNRHSQIRQSSLQLQIAEKELENYQRTAQTELDELRLNHQVAADGVKKYLEHYQLNASNHRIAGEKYNEGVYSIDQYVTIYQERVRSQNLYLNMLANFMIYESMIQTRNRFN